MPLDDVAKNDWKRRGVNISISSLVTVLPILGVVWFLIEPRVVIAVTTLVKADVSVQVSDQIKPLNAAFKAIIQNDIDRTRRQIAELKNIRQFHPEDWTDKDSSELAQLEIELDNLKLAIKEL